jgi:osmotically-inducible protein OsmY
MDSNIDETKSAIINHLFWDARVDASLISVESANGTVTLHGEVPSYMARNAAEEDVWSVPGVGAVQNNLTVLFPSGHTIPSDGAIKDMLSKVLKWDTNIESRNIHIHVEKGVVTLEGTVPAFWQKARIKEVFFDVDGITELQNRLIVVPGDHVDDKLIIRDITGALDRCCNVKNIDIAVRVDNGRVILSGSVPNYSVYKAVENCAQNTRGVLDIVNEIVIL